MKNKQKIGFILGPLLAIVVFFLLRLSGGLELAPSITAGITVLIIVWWMTEPIPIPVVSLLALTLFPLFGIIEIKAVQQAYGHPLILLLLGGFILSTAMAKSGAHQQIAFSILRFFGGKSARSLVIGFMVAAAFLSMWISNTATTLMLLPVALAILDKVDNPKLVAPLLLGTAHAASVGGIGTIIGTPPNLVFSGQYEEFTGTEIDFARWASWGFWVVICLVPLLWLWLTRNLNFRTEVDLPAAEKWSVAQRRVITIFTFAALAWMFRKAPFGGWNSLLPSEPIQWLSHDYMVAFIAIVILFLTPDGKGERLLDWDTATKIPWGMLLLFGAGLTIASAFASSGLSSTLADSLAGLATLPTFLTILIICVLVTFLTEATSNTATTSILMPIMAAAAIGMAIDPLLFMVPATMSASCAFMLPVATPPNVVVYSSGRFPMKKMAQEGFVLNLIGAFVITSLCYLYYSIGWFDSTSF